MTKDYYLGFDLGTNSVGWAVSDLDYVLKKYRGNLMWGVMLFDEAQHSDERRGYRTARRRLNRRNQRIQLLQELLAPEILKKDPHFFDRLRESKLLPEDCENRTRNIYFDDSDYTDKDYYKDYPTIHHLICELMENDKPHDIRLVYLACAYILKHRGHFLIEVDSDNINEVTNFAPLYENFIGWFESVMDDGLPFECTSSRFGDILKKKIGITAKEKEYKALLFGGKTPPQDGDEGYPLNLTKLIKLVCGGKVKLSEIFKNEGYKELEKDTVCVASADFDDELEGMYSQLEEGHGDLLRYVKAMYDWSLLDDILKGCNNISEAKKIIYDDHRKDLDELKDIIRRYLPENYAEIFKEAGDKDNYVCYVQNLKSIKKGIYPKKKCSQEDFCKFIAKYLAKITPKDEDREKYDRIKKRAEDKALCPKQVTSDNRVIPYQLYYAELKAMLDNAEKYLDILNKKDEYGSVKDKILSIMKFRIPYYVGPLVKFDSKNCHAWIEKKAEGKIYPWNFEEKVDLDKTEEAFIRRMTCKCTYIAGEDVLPKNSLLYEKFTVLNEINNISADGSRISSEAKQKIFNHFFVESKARVTKKRIKAFLISEKYMTEEQELSGVDDTLKSSLKSYHDFKRLLTAGTLTADDVERIIERITVTTDKKRLKKWLKENYGELSQEDITYISRLSYKDYGRLSRMLLNGITDVDAVTGETGLSTIIDMLWKTSHNLMELLSAQYGFLQVVESLNEEYYRENPKNAAEMLEEMYVPAAARRTIVRALDIAKEVGKIMGGAPKKIFVEMTRGGGEKGKRTKSRKESIKEYLNLAREFSDSGEIDNLEKQLEDFNDSSLRSEKYYLYFMQLGRCMYSGDAINLDQIGNDSIYNIDHIIPQAKKTDDSLNNKVLVKSELNGAKKDEYPISENIRHYMHGFWKSLKEKGLITEEKYKRLTRSTPFSEEELSEFISRQLVETSQSSKAAAKLLSELFPESQIVYVKAGMVSEFRQKYDMLKCREVNDLHHAKDAYLNIVMGNVHDVLFTKSPVNLIKNGDRYSMKMKTYLSWNIKRGDDRAWDPDVSFATVRKMMSKNSIRYVKYAYCRKGGFYNQNADKAKDDNTLKLIKGNLSVEKYGGFNSSSISYFSLVKCREALVIIPVEVIVRDRYRMDKNFAREYAYQNLCNILPKKFCSEISPNEIEFPYAGHVLKINSLIEINGFRVNLCQKDSGGKYIIVSSAMSLVIGKKLYDYVKTLSGYAAKSENGKSFKVGKYDGINSEKNMELYDEIMSKCTSDPFAKWAKYKECGEKLNKHRSEFAELELTDQALGLLQIVSILKTSRSANVDLTLINESKNTVLQRLNAVISSRKGDRFHIIDQSPTGLFEKRSLNLLEL